MRVSSSALNFHNAVTLHGKFDPEIFKNRRQRLVEQIPDKSLVIIPNKKLSIRSNDTEYKFKPDSDFYYLTGIDEPNSSCVLRKEGQNLTYILFVEPRDEKQEIWTGKKIGLEGAKDIYGANESYKITEFDEQLAKFIADSGFIYFPFGSDRHLDLKIISKVGELKKKNRASIKTPQGLFDMRDLVHKMRLIKEQSEINCIQKACNISKFAHILAMNQTRPGMHEYELEALIDGEFRRAGGVGPAYSSIIGSGNNAATLHYIKNTRKMEDGDLVLVDAGVEFDYYASDVTRTFPVGKKFTEEQKSIYKIVLEAQEKTIEKAVLGVRFIDLYNEAVLIISKGLKDLGLLNGSVEEIIQKKEYEKFFMHKIGHWMGLDVHDMGPYIDDEGKSIKLAPGMILTVEPGIYIPEDCENVPSPFRGIGIRIEDDVLITETGNKVLTSGIPKSIEEIEDIRD